jgi:thiamine-monophosphate kinase
MAAPRPWPRKPAWLGLVAGAGQVRGRREITGEDGSLAGLGEWGIIAALQARMPVGPLTSVGIGDDSAVVGTPSGSVVAAVDMLIEGRHFRRDWSSARDIGVKAAARSLADIAAMGAVSTALLVALAAPGTLPAAWATDLAQGLADEAARAGAGIVGGDTAGADSVLVSVTALGDLEGRAPVLRSGARPGDVIAVTGPLGRSAAGLALLTAGVAGPGAPGDAGPGADAAGPLAGLVAAHLRPAPPYAAGPEAARLGATAMIDVSDGLLADLGHLAAASGAGIDVSSQALAVGTALLAAAAALSSSPESARTDAGHSTTPVTHRQPPAGAAADAARGWVLTGGEDHALVAAFPPGTDLPGHWDVIGAVHAGDGVVTVDGAAPAGPGGWEHFR